MVLADTNANPTPTPAAAPPAAKPEAKPAVPAGKSGILPGSILTQEEKSEATLAKEETQRQVTVLKKYMLVFLFLSLGWMGWIHINISESNPVLSLAGVATNTGQEAAQLKNDIKKAKSKVSTLEKDIDKITRQLEEKNYTRFSEEIREIKEQQILWFDTTDANGTLKFGLADAVPRIQEYFNSRSYSDPESILSGIHGDIKIENLQVSRDEVSFSVDSSQILGKIFFLNIELIEMINSFPFLKNGVIEQFARQKNETDDDSMKFSVRLERQMADEEDPADVRFQEYLDWLNTSSLSN